jgi:hypothetical protein
VKITLTYSNGDTSQGATAYVPDTLSPSWNQTILNGATADGLSNATIDMLDDDTLVNDYIGSCAMPIAPQSGVQTITCDGSKSTYGPGYVLRIQLNTH